MIDLRPILVRHPHLRAMSEQERNKRHFRNAASLNYGPEVARQLRGVEKQVRKNN